MNIPLNPDAKTQTTLKQQKAAHPKRSAWVSANAGSGKTHVLVQRVIRLMLDGADPGKILALTFTTAAAANMANRVFKTLSDWTWLDDAALSKKLKDLDEEVSPARIKRARQLFARAIETPGGLKIQTIHAFCERVLHLFPFEANVPAKFEVLDDVSAAELTGEALHEMLLDALSGQCDHLAEALGIASASASEWTLKELIRSGIQLRQRLSEEGETADEAIVTRFLSLDGTRTVEDVMRDIIDGGFARAEWADFAAAMQDAVDRRMAEPKPPKAMLESQFADMFEGLALLDTLDIQFGLYIGPFCTKEGALRSTHGFLSTLKRYHPNMHGRVVGELARVGALLDEYHALGTAERTRALMTLVDATLDKYRQKKIMRGALDFADLIARTRALLNRTGSAFVLYKLDAGIEHLLVDEAQDTSPAQWDIIQALTSEFFAGETAHPSIRTVFAVGDPKQSIYSFQGADPEAFDKTKRAYAKSVNALADALGDGARRMEDLELTVSFRSAPRILQCVDSVFRDERARGVQEPNTTHESVRQNAPAHIELWDIPDKVTSDERDTWQLPVDEPDEQAPVVQLANRIAREVARWLAPQSSERIEENGTLRSIRAGDIMILVRRRGIMFERIIRALKERGIPVAGADRLTLNAHIAVLDLVSLGRAMLLPDDDLALAEILTSPLFGLNEYDLMRFAPQRGDVSLEAAMRAKAAEHPALAQALAKLDEWWALAHEGGAFTFYARILGAGRARRAMLGRLGPEAGDAVDEFLRVALDHDRRNIPSLSLFLATFDESEITIKRDMDLAGDQVRVMTVHGAKGLEAPVVILPDTCALPTAAQIDALAIYRDAKGRRFPIWAASRTSETSAVNAAREAMVATLGDEYRRLLYVAMTRAKDRLVVAGLLSGNAKAPHEECWYGMIEAALADDWVRIDLDGETLRVIEDRKPVPEAPLVVAQPQMPHIAPAWLGHKAPVPESAPDRLRPSAGNEFAGGDPQTRRIALALGSFVHTLLELLPEVPPARRAEAAAQFAAARGMDVPADKRAAAIDAVLTLIGSPALAALFGPNSRGEVDIAGSLQLADGTVRPITGQVDRLAVTGETIIIADYKTNAVPPQDQAGITESYVEQLALYRAVLAPLYPSKTIACVIIYTATQAAFTLDEDRLERALHRLRSRSAAA